MLRLLTIFHRKMSSVLLSSLLDDLVLNDSVELCSVIIEKRISLDLTALLYTIFKRMDEHHLIRHGSDGLTIQILSFNLLNKKANANGSCGETFDEYSLSKVR